MREGKKRKDGKREEVEKITLRKIRLGIFLWLFV